MASPKAASKPGVSGGAVAGPAPEAVAFWSVHRGLAGFGSLRPCTGAITLTADGGHTFHALLRAEGPVEWVATAGAEDAWALVEGCRSRVTGGESVPYRLLHTVDGGRSWHESPPSEAFNPSFATPTRGIAVASALANTGFIGLPSGRGLLATSDGGRTWRPLPGPPACC